MSEEDRDARDRVISNGTVFENKGLNVNKSNFDKSSRATGEGALNEKHNNRPVSAGKHRARMNNLGSKTSVSKRIDQSSLATRKDLVLKPSAGGNDFIHIGDNQMETHTASGRGGIRMTDRVTRVKETDIIDIENGYKDISMNDQQFDNSADSSFASIIFARPIISEQLLPNEMKKLLGLVKQIKSFLLG